MKHLTGHETLEDVLKLVAQGERILLPVSAMKIILKLLIAKEITTEEAQCLADALECELVDYDSFKSEEIADALFELSSPEINGVVTPARCMELIANLENSAKKVATTRSERAASGSIKRSDNEPSVD